MPAAFEPINGSLVTGEGLEHHFQLRGLNADGLVAVSGQECPRMIFGCPLISGSPFGWSGSSMCQLSLRPLLRPLAGLAANSHFPGCPHRQWAALKSASPSVHAITHSHSRFPLSGTSGGPFCASRFGSIWLNGREHVGTAGAVMNWPRTSLGTSGRIS